MLVREMVVDALHRSIQILDHPIHGKAVLKGQDLNFADIEIDSLSRFEFIMHIEEALEIELDDDEDGAEACRPTGIPRPPALRSHRDCQVESLRAQAKGGREISVR